MAQASQQVSALQLRAAIESHIFRRIEHRVDDLGSFISVKDVALDGQGIRRGQLAINSETAMQQIPIVVGAISQVLLRCAAVILILCENAIVEIAAERSAVLRGAESMFLSSPAPGQQASGSIAGLLRYDIDHAVHRVGAPYGSAGTADHFDAL